jgi:hypothetical protein
LAASAIRLAKSISSRLLLGSSLISAMRLNICAIVRANETTLLSDSSH